MRPPKRQQHWIHWARVVALCLSATIGMATAAQSACVGSQQITSCNTTCTANCWLNGNINCTDGQGITINSGYNLDMCGNDITCTSGTCFTKSAITMVGNSSKVFNSQNTEPVISGYFLTAIDCASKTSSQVIGVRIEDAVTAIYNCSKAQENVLVSAGNGIWTTGVSNSDLISNNYLEDTGPIHVSGSNNITIRDNVIVDPNANIGIDIHTAGGAATVSGNVYFGAGTPIYDNANATYSRNICDSQQASCQSCQANGYCLKIQAPYGF